MMNTQNSILAAINRCNQEIAAALAESQKPHSQNEHVCILLWQMDWEREKACLLDQLAMERQAA